MALADEVEARYPLAVLVQLTNQNDQAASAIDATIMGLAVTDVLTYCATTYDNSEAQHVTVAVEGVVAKLRKRSEAAGDVANAKHDAYIERLESLARVTGRDRITPKSTSVLTPSSERVAGSTDPVRPDTDRPDYEDLIPDEPRSIRDRRQTG